MKKCSIAERLRQVMQTRGLKQVDILRTAEPFCIEYGIKLGRNDLSQYVSGKVEPGQYKLYILSQALNVSEAWLMGYDVPMERAEAITTPMQFIDLNDSFEKFSARIGKITPDELSFIEKYRQLSSDNQKYISGMIDGLLKSAQ